MQARSMKRVVVIVSLVLLAAAAYWFWSPLLALRQMQTAARAMDGAAFNERVDYPRLRESVKASLRGQKPQQAPSSDPAASMGRIFGDMLMGRVIDGLVQPEIVMRMMEQGRFERADQAQVPDDDPEVEKKDWVGEREGMNTFIAFVGRKGKSKDERLGLVMERSGFATWRLVGLRMPAK